jgi:uncharacterized membrane protein
MSEVDLTVELAAPPAEVFALLLDIKRTPEWVTICRKVLSVDPGEPEIGWHCQQLYALRGAPFTVSWELTELRANKLLHWKGRGPARSTAKIIQELSAVGEHATKLRYVNDFVAPGGMLGRFASRTLVGSAAEQEARRSLDRLSNLLRSAPAK